MSKKLIFLALPAIALAGCGQSGEEMKAGNWEITPQLVSFDMPGTPPAMMDAMKKGAETGIKPSTQCITQEEIDKGSFTQQGGADGCKSDGVFKGGTIKGTMTCEASGMKMAMTMNGTTKAETFAIDIDQTVSGAQLPGEMKVKMKLNGKRLGECGK